MWCRSLEKFDRPTASPRSTPTGYYSHENLKYATAWEQSADEDVDVLGGPMGERMRIALFSRVLAEHVPLMDVLPAETEEVATPNALEGRAHDCCRVCEHRSWENDREDCGMLDCMSLVLIDIRRRRKCDVAPAESDSDATEES